MKEEKLKTATTKEKTKVKKRVKKYTFTEIMSIGKKKN